MWAATEKEDSCKIQKTNVCPENGAKPVESHADGCLKQPRVQALRFRSQESAAQPWRRHLKIVAIW